MGATSFEFNVTIPGDVRYAEAMRDLAAHAARYAGCQSAEADRYGAAVESVVRACLVQARSQIVPAVVRRGDGPVEFLIVCEEPVETTAQDAQITIEWTREGGRRMCRVARSMPADV